MSSEGLGAGLNMNGFAEVEKAVVGCDEPVVVVEGVKDCCCC